MAIDLDRIQALIFDIDGTLSDTDDHMVKQLSNWLSPFRWLFKDRQTQKFSRRMIMAFETPGNFIYSALDTLGLDKILAKLFDQSARKKHSRHAPSDLFILLPGIKEMLETLSEKYPMAVVSARNEVSSQLFLHHFGLAPYFKNIVTSQTCPHTKPYPDPLLYAAEQLAVPIENCLMIGDTIVDVDAALAAGAQSLSVLCGFGKEKELIKAGTHHILAETSQLSVLLRSKQ